MRIDIVATRDGDVTNPDADYRIMFHLDNTNCTLIIARLAKFASDLLVEDNERLVAAYHEKRSLAALERAIVGSSDETQRDSSVKPYPTTEDD